MDNFFNFFSESKTLLTIFSALVILLTLVIKQLISQHKMTVRMYKEFNDSYIKQSEKMTSVVNNSTEALNKLAHYSELNQVAIITNTKATEKLESAVDNLKDFITNNIIQSMK
jgi:predicted PurR-regulated permease PerM